MLRAYALMTVIVNPISDIFYNNLYSELHKNGNKKNLDDWTTLIDDRFRFIALWFL